MFWPSLKVVFSCFSHLARQIILMLKVIIITMIIIIIIIDLI